MDGANMPIYSLLEQTAYVVRRKKETTGTLGETESYKRGIGNNPMVGCTVGTCAVDVATALNK